jgi:hypothetical protein
MICHSTTLRQTILDRLHSNWSNLLVNKLEKNRNEIVFGFNQNKEDVFIANPFKDKNDNYNNNGVKDGNSMILLEEISASLKELKF